MRIQNSNGPEIGDRYRFTPAAFTGVLNNEVLPSLAKLNPEITGTVIQVNREHRWFRVEYDGGRSGVLHECFKF